jgi:hypothetical protein
MAHDVFISYASSDKAVADAVCAQLESVHRIRCWIAPRDVTPGASWAQSIIEALDDSKVMVLIFSSKANASMQIEREVERAVHKGINIIPLRIEDTLPTKTLEYFISAPHWLDAMSAPLERHIAKLAASVKALLAKQTPARPLEGAAALSTPEAAHAPGAAVASAAARGRIESRAAASAPSSRSRWLVPAAVALLVIMGIGAFAVRRRGTAPEAASATDSQAASAPASAPGAPAAAGAAPQEPASTMAASPAPASATSSTPATASATPPVAAPASVPSGSAAAAATPGTAAAARLAARGAARTPNLVLELNENLPDDGSIRVEVDGVQRWTEKLTQETKGSSLVLAKGPHEVTVTLLRESGEIRETRSTKLEADPSVTSTVRVRLSRFKRNLELEVVVPKPAPTAAAPPPASAPASTKEPARGTTAAKPAPATR